ncbi:MAG: hypothetical protein WB778_05935 [Thermoplasmata archaeon]
MGRIEILDTFPRFQRLWPSIRKLSTKQQIDAWADAYLKPWPDLLAKQLDNYSEEGVDWRSVARRRIFPAFESRMPAMQRIHRVLLRQIHPAAEGIHAMLGAEFPIRLVLYVGIGCGAGWATTYQDTPSILFGLENAAELGWSGSTSIRALVAHEMAHLVHNHWRSEARRSSLEHNRGSSWWELYTEGFATHCERHLGALGGSHSLRGKRDWLKWCQANRRWLAEEFLRTTKARRSTRRFFGSWYPLREHIETGYYLGSEMVTDWSRTSTLRSIDLWDLPQIQNRGRASLWRMAQ